MLRARVERNPSPSIGTGPVLPAGFEAEILSKFNCDYRPSACCYRHYRSIMATNSAQDYLLSRLWSLRVTNVDGREFVPRDGARSVLARDYVRLALSEAGIEPHELDVITDFIGRGAQTVFAILLHIREPAVIRNFSSIDQLQSHGPDLSLPFRKGALDFLPPATAASFFEAQWAFAVPVFSRRFQHRNLDPKTILPFVTLEYVGKGAFGVVHKMGIHPQHHELHHLLCDDQGVVTIARKELLEAAPQTSDDAEQKVLSKLNCLKHGNIVELLGSYRLPGKLTLLFPLASASLSSCFKSGEPLVGFADASSAILALPGLASALQTLHRYRTEDMALIGCHHDIKPDNILVMDGKFVLSDFGLSTFKDPAQGSNTYFRIGQGFYFSPESEDYDDDFAKGRIGRSSDIWSLGCVILELITFMSSGVTGVAQFEKERKVIFGGYYTTSTFHYGKEENPGVVAQISKLQAEPTGDDAWRDLVDLVAEMLRIDPALRPPALEVCRRLRVVALKHLCRLIQGQLGQQTGTNGIPFDLAMERERFQIWSAITTGPPAAAAVGGGDAYYPLFESEGTFNETIGLLTNLRGAVEPMAESYPPTTNVHTIAASLRQINDALSGLLDRPTQAAAAKELELRILTCDDVDRFPLTNYSLDIEPSEGDSRYHHVAMLAALKHALHLTHASASEQQHRPASEWKFDGFHLYGTTNRSLETFETARFIPDSSGSSPPRDVLVQYLVYDAKWADETVGETLFHRLGALVEFLRAAFHEAATAFCVLECLGYVHRPDRHGFGLVFAFPEHHVSPSPAGGAKTPRPISMNQMMRATKNVRLRPNLGEVFQLAQCLASCLLQYHTIGWLHKSFSSYQVVFFPGAASASSSGRTRNQDCPYPVSDPYVVGFDSSRPDKPHEYSEGPKAEAIRTRYQHPLYATGEHRFCPEFDYFSLGYVLLELGLWKPLEEILGPNPPPCQDQSYMGFLLEDVVPAVGQRMGTIYRDAVVACFTFGIEPTASLHEAEHGRRRAETLLYFRKHVVQALDRCTA